ncbi:MULTISPECIES: hypothetical protein [Amniculibacterium]|uniref:hypothetical protein n=1 Tax=Amniculibacterium TaxID=2715289 RepID=UPI000F5B7BE9|nr:MULTISPECIES: hypothetical protein [Amniculibacterium]
MKKKYTNTKEFSTLLVGRSLVFLFLIISQLFFGNNFSHQLEKDSLNTRIFILNGATVITDNASKLEQVQKNNTSVQLEIIAVEKGATIINPTEFNNGKIINKNLSVAQPKPHRNPSKTTVSINKTGLVKPLYKTITFYTSSQQSLYRQKIEEKNILLPTFKNHFKFWNPTINYPLSVNAFVINLIIAFILLILISYLLISSRNRPPPFLSYLKN